jgi:DNA repair protein RecN (Recombination protein N)
MQELFDSGFYALQELARSVEDYAGSVELDPTRLDEVRRRRDRIFGLLKKYGPTLHDVIAAGTSARGELDLIDTAQFDLANLNAREAEARRRLATEAEKLSEMRLAAAKKLAKAVDALLPPLGMPDGLFSVALTSRDEPTAEGAEDVEFRVALNVGHDDRPLARVASGGELSRVMLALKTILARVDQVPTLIFDEVDAGIGGRVGLRVGRHFLSGSQEHQVLLSRTCADRCSRTPPIVVAEGARAG